MNLTITYDGSKTVQTKAGASLLDILELIPGRKYPTVAAIVNGELQELDYPLYINSEVRWLDSNSSMGWNIYRRSVIYLLLLAISESFPDYRLWVSHSLSEGCFCWAKNEEGQSLSAAEIVALEKKMKSDVEENLAIERISVSREDTVAFFESEGKSDKARLLMRRDQPYLSLYRARNFSEYLFGRMAIRAGLLSDFHLIPFEDGFILRLPVREYLGVQDKEVVAPRQLQATLRDYSEWINLLKVRTISDLNALVEAPGQDFSELVLIAETLQQRILHTVTDAIEHHFPEIKLILLAGPSSSGKTTTARRLCIQFRTLGIQPVLISMDDYFLDQSLTPLNNQGKPDFEGMAAIDLQLFRSNLSDLLEGREASLPAYDFKTGKGVRDHRRLKLDEDQILIVEGIHALNEKISQGIPHNKKRKIFVSALTQLNFDASTPVSSSDGRLIRRIVRDSHSRSMSPIDTLINWDAVRRGEHCNIFPFQEQADFFINSALLYELPVLRPLIEDKLSAIDAQEPSYLEAQRILRLIRYFSPASADLVPRDSVLQEFIGNSIFK